MNRVTLKILLIEFSLNVFNEFRNSVTKILYFKKIIQTCHFLCKRPRCYHSAIRMHVGEGIFKLTPIHAAVIYQIPRIRLISDPFMDNYIAI